MSKKQKIPRYLKDFLQKYPNTKSGRKNYTFYHFRILKTLELIKKYWKDSNN